MANIVQEFTVKAPQDRVFQAMATPEGLAHWWTKTSEGKSEEGSEYNLFFGPEYDWRGRVTRYKPQFNIRAGDNESGSRLDRNPRWM